jgi:hypothetical protein
MIRKSEFHNSVASGLAVAVALAVQSGMVQAGAKIDVDEDTWVSIGGGARASFSHIENQAPNGTSDSKDFALNNARIYINGQLNQWMKFELNTECIFCGSGASFEEPVHLLDAIAKFEFMPEFNLWAGRMLVPLTRAEMSGPFYEIVYDFQKTPFYPSDHSVDFGTGGAGVYGRDNGVTAWGGLGPEGRFKYAVGVYNGLEGLSNQDDELMVGGRFEYQFLSVEPAPAYYKASTYFGGAGDVLTIGYAINQQTDGAGSAANPGDFLGMSVDLLFEKVFTLGVVTVDAEYKWFDADFNTAAYGEAAGNCFCVFDGEAYDVTLAYLIGTQVGWGKFQPYVRYTEISPDSTQDTDEFDIGVNYIMDGFNSRISAFYQNGEINSGSQVNFAPGSSFQETDAFKVAFQMQI